jgi:futalosine hydrolase
MRILIVAATPIEVAPVVAGLRALSGRGPRLTRYAHAAHDVDVLITGVGMVATAAWCSHVLALSRYDLALNFGVCGSFDPALKPGDVVQVVTDCLAELGAEDGEAFVSIHELNLPAEDEFRNVAPPANAALGRLPAVRGITVNTVHGNERSIAAMTMRCRPQVESMEGAAFMQSCLIHEIQFAQVRAVSNVVERRNRDAWKMAEAIGALGVVALSILEHQ